MFPKIMYLYKNSETNYHALIGEFIDNKLEGYGKEIIFKDTHKTIITGKYQNGILNGLGSVMEDDNCIESGLYKDGKLVDIDDFIKDANKKIVEHITKYGYEFHNSILYYHGDDPKNISGVTLLVCEELVVHFISGNQYVKGDKSCYQFVEYKDNEPFGFTTFKCININKPLYYDHSSIDRFDDFYSLLLDNKLDLSVYEWETIRVKEGTVTLKTKDFEISSSLILYLPKSIKKLEYYSIYSRKDYLLEVYYPGTKEEWEKIEKGERRECYREDFYGYYYHNAERYVPSITFKDWAKNAFQIVIHCSDQDIFTKDCSYG